MKSSENGAFSCVESNELFPSALSAAEMIEAQYTCRLFKKVEKDSIYITPFSSIFFIFLCIKIANVESALSISSGVA